VRRKYFILDAIREEGELPGGVSNRAWRGHSAKSFNRFDAIETCQYSVRLLFSALVQ
ncbi:MAG: hypothetical protein ACI8Z5_000530, partial [Lentimonas sp.]